MEEIIKKLKLGKITGAELKEVMLCGTFVKIEKCYLNSFRVTMQYGRSEERYTIELI